MVFELIGSSADNAEYPEVSDEILEVNGRTLENATDAEVSQHIHQVNNFLNYLIYKFIGALVYDNL